MLTCYNRLEVKGKTQEVNQMIEALQEHSKRIRFDLKTGISYEQNNGNVVFGVYFESEINPAEELLRTLSPLFPALECTLFYYNPLIQYVGKIEFIGGNETMEHYVVHPKPFEVRTESKSRKHVTHKEFLEKAQTYGFGLGGDSHDGKSVSSTV